MSAKVPVVVLLGQNKPRVGTVEIEGKITPETLKEKALMVTSIPLDSIHLFELEVRDEQRQITKRITTRCTVFLFRRNKSESAPPLSKEKKAFDFFDDLIWPPK